MQRAIEIFKQVVFKFDTHAMGASLILDLAKMTSIEVREWGKSHAFRAKNFQLTPYKNLRYSESNGFQSLIIVFSNSNGM